MAEGTAGWTLAELAGLLGGKAHGPGGFVVVRPVPAESDDPTGIAFAESERFLRIAEQSKVGAVILPEGLSTRLKPSITVPNARVAFGILLAMVVRPLPLAPGVHPTALIAEEASIDPTASIGPYTVVERGASVGPNCRVFAHCYVGEGCTLAAEVTLHPGVILVQDVSVGPRTTIHSGAVIGADGFGFVWDGRRRVKVPQVGGVRIGADVEIGANTCIDRATCGETVIADGVKLDNLIQIGHNVKVGAHTVIAALTGVSGSVVIGERVMIGGHVAVNDHTEIGDDVILAGRTGIMRSIHDAGEYYGTPATPIREAMRQLALERRLPELFERIKALEAEVERLSAQDPTSKV